MAHEPADTASVFDFLFVDHARVALFNAQFTGMGSMRQIIESESSTGTKGGAVNAAVARAKYDRSASQRLEKAYDAQWAEPLSFLDHAQERGILKPDLASARVGDLVMVRVVIDFLNLASLERVWSEVGGQSGSGGRKRRRDGGKLLADRDTELGLRVFGALDHHMIMVFRGEEGRLWSAVDPANVAGAASALHWKHGARIDGDWHLIGIVDCPPGPPSWPTEEQGTLFGLSAAPFQHGLVTMMSEIGNLIGRPSDCHGVTPLVVLREIG